MSNTRGGALAAGAGLRLDASAMVGASRPVMAVLAVVAVATSSPISAGALAPPSGDRAGLALLARVNRAYARVPAVTIWGRSGIFAFRFEVVLRSGVIVAEQFVGSGPTGTTELVRNQGSPTFAREAGSACWRRLASADQQALDDIGLRFPDEPHMRVEAPRRTRGGWLLPVVGDGGRTVFVIDAKSTLLRSITIASSGKRVLEHVSSLRSVPILLTARPRC